MGRVPTDPWTRGHLGILWTLRAPPNSVARLHNVCTVGGSAGPLVRGKGTMDNTFEVRAGQLVASVSVPDWEPHHITRGGPVTVRAMERTSRPIVLRARWSEESGLTGFDRAMQVDSRLSEKKLAALELALHDGATIVIAISRVAREHRLSRNEAACLLHALVGREGPQGYEAVACRPDCLRSWLDPDNPHTFAGASGWVFWWQESGACVSLVAGGGPLAHHEGVDSMGEAVALAAGRIRCQCGEVTGTRCGHFRLRSEMVVIEWMPYQLRSAKQDSGVDWGTYPQNGALRLLCDVDCGLLLVENEEGWARLILGES